MSQEPTKVSPETTSATQQSQSADQQPNVFKFEVDNDGTFRYYPPGDWAYKPDDVVRFESPSGNFTINFVPKVPPPHTQFNPFGGSLSSEQVGPSIFAVQTTVKDDLTEEQRGAIKMMNISPTDPHGFIARYIYAISVKDANGRIVHKDDTHNGTYSC
jgi:hypothetical protein